MAINSETDINIAIMQLGKQANFYRLDQSPPPHKIIEWVLIIKTVNLQMMS